MCPSGCGCCTSWAARSCCCPRVPPPPQEVRVNRRWLAGRRHSKGRDASAISHHYDVSNTLLRVGARAVDGLHLRLLPARGRDAGGGAGLQVRPGRAASSGCGRACGCWTSAAAGAAWSCTPPGSTACKALGVTLSAQQAAWAQRAIEDAGLADLAEVRHLDYRDVPETGFDAVSSIGLTEHIGKAQLPGYFSLPARQAEAGRAAAQPLHHPARRQPGPPVAGRVHQPVRVPRRRAGGPRPPGVADERRRVRGPARGEPARALRHDPGRPGAPTWTPTGTRRSPRSARARPGCGGCTWPARGSASSATRSSCTRSSASGSSAAGRSGMPLRPDWERRRHRLPGSAGPPAPVNTSGPPGTSGQKPRRLRFKRLRFSGARNGPALPIGAGGPTRA